MGVGTGPEALHDEMTSGRVGTIRGLEADVDQALRDVRESLSIIRYASDRPAWDSDSARRAYNMRAWTTRASAEVCINRLSRAGLALRSAADGYDAMENQAGEQIRWWRRERGKVTDALGMFMLMFTCVNNLTVVRGYYEQTLAAARDFLVADPFGAEESAWLELGLVKSMLRDLEHGTMPGPVIPETLATGQDGAGWTPQGLGYDPETGHLLQTSYQEVVDPATGETTYQAQLSIIDPATGQVVNTVDLGARDGDTPPNHAGGVVVHDGTAWVSSSDNPPRLVPYSMSELSSQSPGSQVGPSGPPQEVRAGASSTVHGDTLYVATFDKSGPGELHTYTWDPDTRSWADPQGPFDCPPKTQGIAVRGNEIVFSTSHGRDNGSTLASYNLDQVTSGRQDVDDPLREVDIPNMSEGLVMLPGGVVSTHESGASPYATPQGADPEDMWAGMFMTVTPYDELGLSGQVDVEPATLEAASGLFAEAESGLDKAEGQVARLRLPASSLGRAQGTELFASSVDDHLDTSATWLGESRISSGVTASGLVRAAGDYQEADDSSSGLFGLLQKVLP